jgi:hypothetical protein
MAPHFESGKRVYQLYAELDQEDPLDINPSDGLLTLGAYMKTNHDKDSFAGPWGFETMGNAGGQTVVGAFSTGTHGGDFESRPDRRLGRGHSPRRRRRPPLLDRIGRRAVFPANRTTTASRSLKKQGKTADEINIMTVTDRKELAKAAGCNKPSDKSWALVLEVMSEATVAA